MDKIFIKCYKKKLIHLVNRKSNANTPSLRFLQKAIENKDYWSNLIMPHINEDFPAILIDQKLENKDQMEWILKIVHTQYEKLSDIAITKSIKWTGLEKFISYKPKTNNSRDKMLMILQCLNNDIYDYKKEDIQTLKKHSSIFEKTDILKIRKDILKIGHTLQSLPIILNTYDSFYTEKELIKLGPSKKIKLLYYAICNYMNDKNMNLLDGPLEKDICTKIFKIFGYKTLALDLVDKLDDDTMYKLAQQHIGIKNETELELKDDFNWIN